MIRVRVEPSAVNGLRTRSHIMLDKVTSVPVNEVGPVFGRLDDADMLRVNRALALFLGIVS